MITLFGATGHTGKLISLVLDRKGVPFRIAGRSEEKLRQLSSQMVSRPEWLVADATRADSLPTLFKGTRVMINCAGPFTDIGEKVASLAAVNGIHYLDTTNELGYVYRMRSYDKIAKRTGTALVPSCAFEVALADCAAAVLAKKNRHSIRQIDVVYHLAGAGTSRGTRLSALRSLATSWLSYKGKEWIGTAPGVKRSRFNLQHGRFSAVSFPSSESVTLTSHLDPDQINTWMTVSNSSALFAPLFLPFFARFLRSLPGRSILWAAGLSLFPTKEEIRSKNSFEILVSLKDNRSTHQISVIGNGPYEMTANIAVRAAEIMAAPGFCLRGVLSPAQVLDPEAFFALAGDWGIRLVPESVAAET